MTNETDLHRAARAPYQQGDPLPRLEVVRDLLDVGAEVDAIDGVGYTPLMRAAMLNEGDAQATAACLAVLRLLRERGARVPAEADHAPRAADPAA